MPAIKEQYYYYIIHLDTSSYDLFYIYYIKIFQKSQLKNVFCPNKI